MWLCVLSVPINTDSRRHPWTIKQALALEEVLNKGLLKEAVSLKVTLCGAQDQVLPPSNMFRSHLRAA